MGSKIVGLACSFFATFAFLVYMIYDSHSLTPYGFYGLSSPTNPFIRSSFTKTVDFSEHDDYKDLSPQYDFLWEEILTPNGGFLIKVEQGGSTRRHGIGMFHQLHCLQMIRGALQSRGDSGQPKRESPHEGHRGNEDHMLHCLDYLRQTILCMADDTIETPKRRPDGRNVIDGMFTHQCRDSKPVYDMALNSPPYYAPAS